MFSSRSWFIWKYLLYMINYDFMTYLFGLLIIIIIFWLQVMMKDVATPVPQNEVRAVIKKSLENAALVNYERLSEEARIEAEMKNKQGE